MPIGGGLGNPVVLPSPSLGGYKCRFASPSEECQALKEGQHAATSSFFTHMVEMWGWLRCFVFEPALSFRVQMLQ